MKILETTLKPYDYPQEEGYILTILIENDLGKKIKLSMFRSTEDLNSEQNKIYNV
jgi:hypothetical protein